MRYAVKDNNGDYTGTVYESLNDNIIAHHKGYGDTLHAIKGLHNVGTDDKPTWEPLPETEEEAGKPHQLDGCIAVGEDYQWWNGYIEFMVTNSRRSLENLMDFAQM